MAQASNKHGKHGKHGKVISLAMQGRGKFAVMSIQNTEKRKGPWWGKKPRPDELANILTDHRNWLESAGAKGGRAELQGSDLTEATFMTSDLREADLYEADLHGANLEGANLSKADLHGANFQSAYLRSATLIEANLQGADLSGANLSSATLNQAKLQNAILKKTNLVDAVLTEAKLQGANLESARAHKAKLNNANLSLCVLKFAELHGAELSNADLKGADLTGAILVKGKLHGANFEDSNLCNTDLQSADLYGANLKYASLDGANLQGASLQNADAAYTFFNNANLRNAKLVGADFAGSMLNKADLSGADVTETNFFDADLTGALLQGVDLSVTKQGVTRTGDSVSKLAPIARAPRKMARENPKVRKPALIGTMAGEPPSEGPPPGEPPPSEPPPSEPPSGEPPSGEPPADQSEDTPLMVMDLARRLREVDRDKRLDLYVEKAAGLARKIFTPMLLTAAYVALTLWTTPDLRELFRKGVGITLPLLQKEMPIDLFFVVAPLLLAGLYLYFHLYLRQIWAQFAEIPDKTVDGVSWEVRVYPWIILKAARVFAYKRFHDLEAVEWLQALLPFVLGWCTIPAVLFLTWWKCLDLNSWPMSSLHISCVIVSILFEMLFVFTIFDSSRSSRKKHLAITLQVIGVVAMGAGMVILTINKFAPINTSGGSIILFGPY